MWYVRMCYTIIYIYTREGCTVLQWSCILEMAHPGEWPGQALYQPIQSAQPKRQASIHEAGISKILQAHPACQDLSRHYQGWYQGWYQGRIRLILAPAGNVPDESAGLTSQSSSKYGNEQPPQNIPTKQPSAQPNDLSNCQPTCEGTQNTAIQDRKEPNQKRLQWATRRINQTHTHNLSRSASKQ